MFRRFSPFLIAVCVLGVFSAAAQAEANGPVWKVMAVSNPTNFEPGDQSGDDAVALPHRSRRNQPRCGRRSGRVPPAVPWWTRSRSVTRFRPG
jgi:hypothetical protein